MLNALDQHGVLVASHECKSGLFSCPGCKQQVLLKQGLIRKAHFAHLRQAACTSFSEAESAEHLELKQLFQEWGTFYREEFQLEKPLPELAQRADLCCDKLAVEIQCSPLSIKRLAKRHQGYQRQDYQDWWLLGTKLFQKKKLSYLQKGLLYYSPQRGIHLWEADLAQKVIRLRYNIEKTQNGLLLGDEIIWQLRQASLQQIFQWQPATRIKKQRPEIWGAVYRQTLQKRLRLLHSDARRIQERLYFRKQSLLGLPALCYAPTRYYLIFGDWLVLFRWQLQQAAGSSFAEQLRLLQGLPELQALSEKLVLLDWDALLSAFVREWRALVRYELRQKAWEFSDTSTPK